MRFLHIQAWRFALVGLLCAGPTLVQAQMDPVFTYQGQLKEEGRPYDGTTYLEFTLWDAPELGTQIGSPYWTYDGVSVVNGLFTVEVDAMLFGPTAFNGAPLILDASPVPPSEVAISPEILHPFNLPCPDESLSRTTSTSPAAWVRSFGSLKPVSSSVDKPVPK